MTAINKILLNGLAFTAIAAMVFFSSCSRSSTTDGSSGSTNAVALVPVEPSNMSAAGKIEQAPAAAESVTTNEIASDAPAAGQPIIEVQIRDVTSSDRSAHEKAVELLAMFSKLSREGQRKVAHAIVAHVTDDDFGLVREQLLNPKLHPQVLSVFMTDTLKRENNIRLPMLRELTRMDGHPLQAEAQQLLPVLVSANFARDSQD